MQNLDEKQKHEVFSVYELPTKKTNKFPLIVETNTTELQFLTLIEHRDVKYYSIIEGYDDTKITAYILDFCKIELTPDFEMEIINIAKDWFDDGYNLPISISFMRYGIGDETDKIKRSFNLDSISRIIGFVPNFNFNGQVKRRTIKLKL
jgi:hypothetical protein